MGVSTRKEVSHAVVIGGGIAGLLAARVLQDHCTRVTLIERDHYPAEAAFRPGVPQGRHVHVLLVRGQLLLEELFPGFIKRLVELGAVPLDFLQDMAVRYPADWLPRIASTLPIYCCTRPLLEGLVRQEVLRSSTLKIIEGYEVTDLHFASQGHAVTGVHARRRGHDTALDEPAEQDLDADLVVDASGRESPVLRWLAAGGFPLPEETVLNPFLGYASCFYQLAPDVERTWQGLIIATDAPRNPRGGTIIPVEGERWHVVLAGASKDYPPTDQEGFLAFARGMTDPLLAEVLERSVLLSPIYGYRRTENRWRHFERLQRHPDGLYVIGDAVCAFDPVYGQGMTVAALGAMALQKSLRREPSGRAAGQARRFQRALARQNSVAWGLSIGADYRALPLEEQTHGWFARLTDRYFERMTAVMPGSAKLCKAFVHVTHLLKSPLSLFHPALAWIILTQRKRG